MKKPLLLVALALAACAHDAQLKQARAPLGDWKSVATNADRERLSQWRTAFVAGLDQARSAGHAAEIAHEGRLLDPDAGTAGRWPPAGDYICRVIKLGSRNEGGMAYVSYAPFACRIGRESGTATFWKMNGSQRTVGRIIGDAGRLVFLGTLVLGDEQRAIDYGRDAERDMIGAIEGLGNGRWRLILPYPHFESVMDVVELVPVSSPA
jgi:hypothetical protein